MVTAVILALIIGGDAPIAIVAIVAFAVVRPFWFLCAVGVWAVVQRRRETKPTADDEADVLRGVAAELVAGASLRSAIAAASARVPVLGLGVASRRATAGLPFDRVAAAMSRQLPVNGRAVSAALALAGTAGAPSAGLFVALADRATEMGRLERERRALSAQARLSAVLVGGLPMVVAFFLLASGRAASLMQDALGRVVVIVGVALIAAGALLVAWMVRRR